MLSIGVFVGTDPDRSLLFSFLSSFFKAPPEYLFINFKERRRGREREQETLM